MLQVVKCIQKLKPSITLCKSADSEPVIKPEIEVVMAGSAFSIEIH